MTRTYTRSIFDAAMICEGVMEAESNEEYLDCWQQLVDTGTCWQLQGWFGRTAQMLIDEGLVRPSSFSR